MLNQATLSYVVERETSFKRGMFEGVKMEVNKDIFVSTEKQEVDLMPILQICLVKTLSEIKKQNKMGNSLLLQQQRKQYLPLSYVQYTLYS